MATTPPASSRARRTGSHTSLTHLTLAPLTTGRPLVDVSDYEDPLLASAHTYASTRSRRPSTLESSDGPVFSPPPTTSPQQHYHHHLGSFRAGKTRSYTEGRSAPTTPGILSRAQSPTRPARPGGSKSFTHLVHVQSGPTPSGLLHDGKARDGRERARRRKNRESSEWFYRAGVALTGEARDSKGQGWVVRRASSTSLAREASTGVSEGGMRSRRTSRRVSRANMAGLSMTSTRSSGTALASEGDYFGSMGVTGPDFVDGAEEEEEEGEGAEDDLEEENEQLTDDAEVAKLARQSSGFGFSRFVDRVVGLSLFDVGGDGGRKEEEEEELQREEVGQLKRVRDSQRELAGLAKSKQRSTDKNEETGPRKNETENGEEGSGWTDAAWLLSVASRVLF